MTPQERDLIVQLLGRLKQAGGQAKDPEADQLIRQALAEQPDAPYYLVQTVLIQDMALGSAQNRIAELERQLAAAKPAQPTSFLGGLFGHAATAPAAGAPAPGPWSRPAPGPQAQPPYQQPQYQAPPQPAMAGPWGGQPMMGQGMPMMAGGSGGFLRQAATTAAGIAGGALLFEGIQSLFGQHAGGILSNAGGMQPGISETVINNYYGSDPATQAAWNDPGSVPADFAADAPVDPGVDYAADDPASDQDFASDDFGGNDDLA